MPPPVALHSTAFDPVSFTLAQARQSEARAQAWAARGCEGLRRALAQAALVVVCAVGPDREAALLARACYSAVAQLPVWVLHPDEIEAMGAGLWRLTQLFVVAYGEGTDAQAVAACHNAVRLAQSYHCPVLALVAGAAPELPEAAAGRAPWALPTEGLPQASHGAFALPYLGHLALACAAAQARAAKSVASPAPEPQAATALGQAWRAYPADAQAQAAVWATDAAHQALAEHCAQGLRVSLTTAQWQLLPTLRALALARPYVDACALAEAEARPCLQGTVQLHIGCDAQGLCLRALHAPDLAVTVPLPARHGAPPGLWAHLVLGLLLPER